MKKFFIFISFLCLLSSLGAAQVEPYGLDSLIVTDLRFYAGELYASTDSHGVFKRSMADTDWASLGLEGKRIETVYPHQVTGNYSELMIKDLSDRDLRYLYLAVSSVIFKKLHSKYHNGKIVLHPGR